MMKKKEDFEDCASRLKAIADPDRLRIVSCLFAGEKNVTDLAEELGDEIVKVSHHLGVLRNAGVVEAEKKGRYVIYRLHPDVRVTATDADKPLQIDFGCCLIDLKSDL